ncbi:ABC transporter permease [Desulfatirhabdium butyrativorans]|uniref:ABC transporter permease n=1 Tax=Desulfatirhabdium butyrativorans TaxID=340467 RepID=UPI000419CE36|nr:ABC transporter permease [Desulfatirhabdium butyrativorans]
MITAQIKSLALHVWRDALRNRGIQGLVSSGILMLFVSNVLGNMAVGGKDRVLQNAGFWILGIWGLITVAYLGFNLIRQEFQRQTAYLILYRPISRSVFLMGKFAGVVLVLMVVYAILCGIFLLHLKWNGIAFNGSYLPALVFIAAEWILMAALSLFFATVTTPVLHLFFLTGIVFLGHWLQDLLLFSQRVENPLIHSLLIAAYQALPNLEALNFRQAALYADAVPPDLVGLAVMSWLGWVVTLLLAANAVFLKRRLL